MTNLVNLLISQEVVELIEIDGEHLEILSIGMQGPPGVSGTMFPVNFAFGNATPALLTTIPAGKRVYSVELFVETAFDGAGASLSVGPLAAPQELMATTENNPAALAVYETSPDKLYIMDTAIYLHITPGAGASAGNGQVRLHIEP